MARGCCVHRKKRAKDHYAMVAFCEESHFRDSIPEDAVTGHVRRSMQRTLHRHLGAQSPRDLHRGRSRAIEEGSVIPMRIAECGSGFQKSDSGMQEGIPIPELRHSTMDSAIGIASYNTFETRSCNRIGLRSLELVQDPHEWGKTFYFRINGVPIFAKGADWVPADQFPSRLTEEQYRDLIASAASANMNMFRLSAEEADAERSSTSPAI